LQDRRRPGLNPIFSPGCDSPTMEPGSQHIRQKPNGGQGAGPALGKARRDLLALGIAAAAILMFVGTGGTVLPAVVDALQGRGLGPDRLLTNALLLNIALVIFGWRRYRQLIDEVANRRRAEDQARQLAEIDPLTGCLNRRSITPAITRLMASVTARGHAAAFLMIDLDRFKQINDFNGHAAGDALLRESARRIRALLPQGALLARLGGDEFACVVPFDPAHETIDQLIETLSTEVSRRILHDGIELETTISMGITRSDQGHGTDSTVLLHKADIAMYHAKKHGRNRAFWFEPAMESELRFRTELEAGIRRGIPANEFVPYYEKQIDLDTGELSGFEMLARWNSPQLGLVSPDLFIPIAEELGLIERLSEALIRQALADARDWSPRLTLSVNISPIQLRDPWFAQKLLRMLVEANFPPSRLEVEITETSLHDNLGLVRSHILSLRNQGVKVSLDDFGTGYSSLAQLHTLPIDRIKIDRSFVSGLPDNPDSATIVQSIIALSEGLGLPITAEGVENEAVLAELRKFGRFKGQGYLYGQPEAADKTAADLAQLDLLHKVPASLAEGEQAEQRHSG